MAKSKLLQIWILKSEELDDEMRLKTKNSDIVIKKEGKVCNGSEMSTKIQSPDSKDTDIRNTAKTNICKTCNFTTEYPRSLINHKLKECANYKCNQCIDPKAFTKSELKKHKVKAHKFSPEPWLTDVCHLCPVGLDPTHTLRLHSVKGFSKVNDIFLCDTCKQVFEKKSNIRIHLKISFGCFRMRCPNCDFKTYIEKSFCRHKCEVEKDGDSNQIKCEECDYKDKSAAKVIEHTGVAHDGIVQKCECCLFTSPFRSELLKHSRVTHNVSSHLVCKSCPYVGKSKFETKNHREKVHAICKIDKDGTVGCLSCDFKSDDKSRNGKTSVKRHYMTIHKKIKQTCNVCDLTFSNKSSLTLHKTRKHEPVLNNFKCTYCDFKTNLKWIMSRHIGSIHEGRRIKCPHCHFEGYEKRHTETHIKMYHLQQLK